MVSVVLLINWGFGMKILSYFHEKEAFCVNHVFTQFGNDTTDPWINSVYQLATKLSYNVHIITDNTLPVFKSIIKKEPVDFVVMHAYHKKIPPEIYTLPRLGFINIHASLLPKYRGQNPNYWVLKNKDNITGITTHKVDNNFDSGDIIHQITLPVFIDDTIESLIERQKEYIYPLLDSTFENLFNPNFQPIPQSHALATYAPKI